MPTDIISELRKETGKLDIGLTRAQEDRLLLYGKILAEENEKSNLTAIPVQKYVTEHYVDSFTVVKTGKIRENMKVADVGTGAGFPGLPLKILKPGISLFLIEANNKKANFLNKVIAELGIEGAEIIRARAEEAGRELDLREKMDVVVARAVASLPVLLEYALPLCKVGGWFLAMKGPGVEKELEPARLAAAELGSRIDSVLKPYGQNGEKQRTIVQVQKDLPIKEKYPRRTGIPTKRPLGGHIS